MDKNRLTALFKRDVRPANIIMPFILANMGLFAMVIILWLYPAATSWLNIRDIVNRQRQVYAVYLAQAGQYSALYTVHTAEHVLPYAYLAITLDEIQSLARYYGLDTSEFRSSEPVVYDAGEIGNFVEIRVIASFIGQYSKIEKFTYGLADSTVFVRNLRMDYLDNGTVDFRVEFSLFGRGE